MAGARLQGFSALRNLNSKMLRQVEISGFISSHSSPTRHWFGRFLCVVCGVKVFNHFLLHFFLFPFLHLLSCLVAIFSGFSASKLKIFSVCRLDWNEINNVARSFIKTPLCSRRQPSNKDGCTPIDDIPTNSDLKPRTAPCNS